MSLGTGALNVGRGPEHFRPGARFSKVPKTFRARKAIRKTPTRLFCEVALFICCKGNKNLNNCKVSCLEMPLLWKHKENYVTRKVPEKFLDFREPSSRAGRYPWQPRQRDHPCKQLPTGTVTLNQVRGKILTSPLILTTKVWNIWRGGDSSSCTSANWSMRIRMNPQRFARPKAKWSDTITRAATYLWKLV